MHLEMNNLLIIGIYRLKLVNSVNLDLLSFFINYIAPFY